MLSAFLKHLSVKIPVAVICSVLSIVSAAIGALCTNEIEEHTHKVEKGADGVLNLSENIYMDPRSIRDDIKVLDKIIREKSEQIKERKGEELNKYLRSNVFAGNEEKIMDVGTFYIKIQACVESKFCNDEITKKMFLERGMAFRAIFEPFFQDLISKGDYTGIGREYKSHIDKFYKQSSVLDARKELQRKN